MNQLLKVIIAIFCFLSIITGGVLWVVFGDPSINRHWQFQVYQNNIELVSALAFDSQNNLYATEEKKLNKGRLIKITPQHQIEIKLTNLNKPDGLTYLNNTLYLTQEYDNAPITVLKDQQISTIPNTNKAEQISATLENNLLVIEDNKNKGRLLKINLNTHKTTVLLTDLSEAEGVCQSSTGVIYFTEKTKGLLEKLENGQRSIVLAELDHPSALTCLANEQVLISEERTNFGRLLSYQKGQITVIASRLRAPQEVIMGADGALYLAEQNKNRILRFEKK